MTDDVIERLMRAAVDPTGMSAQEADQMRIMVVLMLRALVPGDALPNGCVVVDAETMAKVRALALRNLAELDADLI